MNPQTIFASLLVPKNINAEIRAKIMAGPFSFGCSEIMYYLRYITDWKKETKCYNKIIKKKSVRGEE